MKPLKFLCSSLFVAAGLAFIVAWFSLVWAIWVPTTIGGILNPLLLFWKNMVATGFMTGAGFFIAGLIISTVFDNEGDDE